MPDGADTADMTPSARRYVMIATLIVWALVVAATALFARPLMIATLTILALLLARELIGRFVAWRTMTWVLLAVNALFVLWIAKVIIELPKGCVRVRDISGQGSDAEPVTVPCPAPPPFITTRVLSSA